MFCNSCNNGNNNLWLIILIIILFGGCNGGYNGGCCGNNCGCTGYPSANRLIGTGFGYAALSFVKVRIFTHICSLHNTFLSLLVLRGENVLLSGLESLFSDLLPFLFAG